MTFKMAFDKFGTPPERALNITPGKPLDFSVAVQSFAFLIVQVLLLLVMAIVGAIIALISDRAERTPKAGMMLRRRSAIKRMTSRTLRRIASPRVDEAIAQIAPHDDDGFRPDGR